MGDLAADLRELRARAYGAAPLEDLHHVLHDLVLGLDSAVGKAGDLEDNSARLAALRSEIGEMQNENASLEKANASLRKRVETLSQEVADLTKHLDELRLTAHPKETP